MLPIRYLLPLFFLGLLANIHQAQAQCNADAVVTNVTCNGLSDGSIDMTPSDGTAPYTYAWSNNQTSEDLTNLSAGTYTCTITDALACIASIEVMVEAPDVLTVSTPGGILTCQFTSITINTAVTGGTAPYTYLWSNGETVQKPVVFTPDTYMVTTTDAQGCTATSQAVVTANQYVPGCSISPPGILTCVSPTVTMTASCAPSGPQIIYQWTGPSGGIIFGANTATVTVVQPGNYTVSVADMSNLCFVEFSMVVTQDYNQPTANAGPDKTLNCINTSLQLDGTGSSPGPNYAYVWFGPGIVGGGTTLNPTVNQPGTYQLMVTNTVNGCTATDNVVVSFLGSIPTADAGPDLGLPCNGDPVTLIGSCFLIH